MDYKELIDILQDESNPNVLDYIDDAVTAINDLLARARSEEARAAKARGIKFGRPKRELPDNFDFACALVADSQISKPVAARACGLPLTTFIGKMKERDK